MSIHPAVWIVTGGIITLTSWLVGQPLILFFYMGIVFFGYGIFRALLHYVVEHNGKEEHSAKERQKHAKELKKGPRTICFFCKKDVSEGDAFCRHCGAKLQYQMKR